MKRFLVTSIILLGLTACQKPKEPPFRIPTATVKRQTINVSADATGKIEPINVVDIKSKAGGQIINMPVESGTHVMKNDIIVEIDKRDVLASLQQAVADSQSAVARLENSKMLLAQNQQLYKENALTKRELNASELDVTTQQTNVVRAIQALELAKQRVADATILAPQEGTILDKIVSQGTVIASASNSASGGTTLVKMADLSTVRARVLVSEADIGKIEKGMQTSVMVDAFPNRPFIGRVEKMEPQAIVDQNVTMFPVLVTLANEEGALMPGMNGEVNIQVETKSNVLAIPLDAFRMSNEAGPVAEMFGLTKEIVDSVARAGQQRRPVIINDDSAAAGNRQPATGNRAGAGAPGNASQQNGRQGGGSGGRGGNTPQVTDDQCSAMTAAITKAGVQKQLDDLRTKSMEPDADRAAIRTERQGILTKAGIEEQTYNSCLRRQMTAAGNQGGASGGRNFGGGAGGRGGSRGGRGGRGGGVNLGNLGQRNGGLGVRGQGLAQSGIVFVKVSEDTTVSPPKVVWEPRFVQLGAQNYDFAEVTSGLKEGEEVALLAAAKIEIQRRQASDRQKANSSLIPGMGTPSRGMPGGGGPGGPGGGGGGGRGGRGG